MVEEGKESAMKKLAVAVLMLSVLMGCDGDRVSGVETNQVVVISSNSRQDVYEVPYESMKLFLVENKDRQIRSLCPVDRAGHGFTTSFLVVLEKQRAEKE